MEVKKKIRKSVPNLPLIRENEDKEEGKKEILKGGKVNQTKNKEGKKDQKKRKEKEKR